jgi:GTP-binding protein EngB required for normal cell division
VTSNDSSLLLREHESLLRDQRELLDRVAALAAAVDPGGADVDVAQALRRHVDERFLLVVVGEVKAGKSTFINVLLGRDVCAVGPTPVTDRISVLQYGDPEAERVVEEYLVERDLPLDLLREVSIVDTPGTNSILREHSALTERFVPRADLVLFLTSIDRPLSESESRFLSLIAERWRKKVVFLLTKIDGREPGDVEQVVAWIRRQCLTHHGFEPRILPVSARTERAGGDGGFAAVRSFVQATLTGGEKMRLKLESPMCSAAALLQSAGAALERATRVLDADFRAVSDLDRQVEQAARDLKERAYRPLAEIQELFPACEARAQAFFARTGALRSLAFGRKDESLRDRFQSEVVAELDVKYREQVGRTLDWLLKEEIALFERCAAWLSDRLQPLRDGRALPATAARFEYRREELFRTLAEGFAREAAAVDLAGEPRRFLDAAERGVRAQLWTTVGGIAVGAGSIAFVKTLTAVGMAGGLVVAAGLGLGGMAILPAMRRRALRRFSERLEQLRGQVRDAFVRPRPRSTVPATVCAPDGSRSSSFTAPRPRRSRSASASIRSCADDCRSSSSASLAPPHRRSPSGVPRRTELRRLADCLEFLASDR